METYIANSGFWKFIVLGFKYAGVLRRISFQIAQASRRILGVVVHPKP